MVLVRQALVISVLMFFALLLAGCGGLWQLAFGIDDSDMPGVWVAELPDAPDASIQMNAEGTFSAVGWPENLVCVTPHPEAVDGLRGQKSINFAGRWEFGSLKSQPQVLIRGQGNCRVSFYMWILRFAHGELALEIVLDSIEVGAEVVRFHKADLES